MNQKTIALFVVLFALIVIGMFVYAHLKKAEIVAEPLPQDIPETETEASYADITRIDGTHYYIDGVHTIVGEIILPTPCDLLETDVQVAESYPEQVQLQFTVINNADTCAQVLTAQRFKVSAEASADASFSATFMGRDIELNLKPAPEGETPEDFEVFIKG